MDRGMRDQWGIVNGGVEQVRKELAEIVQTCIVSIGNAVAELRPLCKWAFLNGSVERLVPVAEIQRWELPQPTAKIAVVRKRAQVHLNVSTQGEVAA